MTMGKRLLFVCLVIAATVSCGGKNNSNDSTGGDGSTNGDGTGNGDGGGNGDGIVTGDGGGGGGACTPQNAQCNNCADDDSDGKIDGFDPECTGPLDNDEG